MRTLLSVMSLTLGLSGCVDVAIDDDESIDNLPELDGPTVEFDPGASIIPFPNNLLLNPANGLVNLPEQCGETATAAALRTQVLNGLDGFGLFKAPLSFTVTEAVEMSSLTDRVKLYRASGAEGAIAPADAVEVPVVVIPGQTTRSNAECTQTDVIDNVSIVPAIPLAENSQYIVVVQSGVTTAAGTEYVPSATWGLVRQAENPVTVAANGTILAEKTPFDPSVEADAETIRGIDLLWRAHADLLAFLDGAAGTARSEVLLAWSFKTQSVLSPFDPMADAGPRLALLNQPIAGMVDIDSGSPTALIESVLGAGACTQLGGACAAVGAVKAGAIVVPNFQADTPNPLAGGVPVPGPWPSALTPPQNGSRTLSVLAFRPATPTPPDGYPVVIYGHGITRSKNDLFAVGAQLAAAGFASIGIDWVAHGDPNSLLPAGRAVQISDTGICAGTAPTPDPTDTMTGGITCFSPFLSSNLAAARDNVRQSVLDALGLVNALKECTGNQCAADFNIDRTKIGFLGQSLGGILGAMVVSQSDDIGAAVLNVTGVGLTDIIENSGATALLQCPLVDALIEAGVLMGTVSDPLNQTGTCYEENWQATPQWQGFAAVARWAIDAGESANYTGGLLGRPVLVQEVDGDNTVPNVSTTTLVSLLGLTAEDAATNPGTGLNPSPAIDGMAAHVRYLEVPEAAPFPGNSYSHGSLLAPAGGTPAGGLGTQQMQIDAITHLAAALGVVPPSP